MEYHCMKLVQNNQYLFSTRVTDGLVHQCICIHSTKMHIFCLWVKGRVMYHLYKPIKSIYIIWYHAHHLVINKAHWTTQSNQGISIGIDTNIEVIVVSLTTWEAHHSPRAKPEGCGELPRSLMRQQWPKLRYQFLFYHDETKLMINKQILSI